MRLLFGLLLLSFASLCAPSDYTLASGVPLAARERHCAGGNAVSTVRRNLAISIGPGRGQSDLKLRMAIKDMPVRKGEPLEGALIGQGGTGVYVYSVLGSLPPGVSLDTATGLLSGTPTTVGHYSFLGEVQDSEPAVYKCTLSINVIPAFTVVAGSPTPAENGVAYNYQFIVSGATGAVTYALTSGSLPSGLSVDAAGLLSGTPSDFGLFAFTVTATDAGSGDALDIHCSLFNYLELGSASIFSPFNSYVVGVFSDAIYPSGSVVTGGVPVVKFAFTDLPSWVTSVSYQNADGISGARYPILHGTPDTAGANSITYTATDALGITATKTFDFNVIALSTATALGTSDLLFPSQKAVKTYVDAHSGGSATTANVSASATLSHTINRYTAGSVAGTTPAAPADFDELEIAIEDASFTLCSLVANAGQTVNGGSSFLFDAGILPCVFRFRYNLAATNWFPLYYRIGTL